MALPDDLSSEALACLGGESCSGCNHLSCDIFLKGRALHLARKKEKTVQSLEYPERYDESQLSFKDRELEDMEVAQYKMKESGYGYCDECQKPIPKGRLEALPEARRCVPCEEAATIGSGATKRRG